MFRAQKYVYLVQKMVSWWSGSGVVMTPSPKVLGSIPNVHTAYLQPSTRCTNPYLLPKDLNLKINNSIALYATFCYLMLTVFRPIEPILQ